MKTYSFGLVSVLVCFTLAVPLKEASKKPKDRSRYIPKKFHHETCDYLGICDSIGSYPIKTIQKLVKRKKNLPLFSNVSLIEPADDMPAAKMRVSEELNNLCRTRTLTVTPKVGYDYHSGEPRFIINVANHVQTVVYETCAEPNQPCIDSHLLPYDYHTQCTQKYNIIRLVSLTKDRKVEYGKFKVPSTCVCSQLKLLNNEIMPIV
ncbi:neurotrophin 1-like [Euwallacea fornicatus]|uniref:neurotrophin 1-like n=1 Tax=Euwallacea fornicatus TaxID=995702 RepID=UPI00338D8D27